MTTASLIVDIAGWWLIAGSVVSLLFLTIGIDRIDEDSRGAYAFRPLLVPGILLVWPLVLWRWFRLETSSDRWKFRYRPPREAHFFATLFLVVLLSFFVLVGLAVRQEWPEDTAPLRLIETGQ